MIVQEFLTKLGFTVDEKPLEGVEKRLEQIKNRLDLFAAAEIVKGLFELTERFARLGEEIHVAAASAGITVEAFQKLAFAASQSGVSQEQMQHGMALLSRRMYEARTGSEEARKAFAKAGISPEQVKGFKTSQEALLALSDRFSKIKDPIAKMGAAQELLGRGGYQMVAFLGKGSAAIRAQGEEAERLGLILSGPQIEALENVEHAFQKLFGLFKAVGAFIASTIGPVFTFLTDKFLEFFAVNKDLVGVNIHNWLVPIAGAMGFLAGLVLGLTQRLIDLAKHFHVEGHILSTVMAIGSLVIGIFTLAKTIGIIVGLIESFGTAWAVLVTAFEAGAAILSAPFIPVIAIVGAVVLAVHELYALLSGKPTWLGQFWDWLKSLSMVKIAMEYISDLWGKITNAGSDIGAGLAKFLGIGQGAAGTPEQRVAALGSPATAVSSISNFSSSTGGNSSVEVNAPMTFHVPPGTDPKEVGQKVKESVREHFERVGRELQRSTLTPQAH